jgi:hypothetical protein
MISQRKRLSAREVAKAETANKLANIKEAIKGYWKRFPKNLTRSSKRENW